MVIPIMEDYFLFEKKFKNGYNPYTIQRVRMMNEYTVIVRKSKLEYVGVCLDLNVSARGVDLADVEKNLFESIQLYLQDIKENPGTVVSPIPTLELIEFLQDTEPARPSFLRIIL